MKTNDKAIRIECGICKKPFSTLQVKQKYCSDECKAEAKREANRRFYRVHGSDKADPKNQMRTLIEQYLWVATGKAMAEGWMGGESTAYQQRATVALDRLGPMSAATREQLADVERLNLMLTIRALAGAQTGLTMIKADADTLRIQLAAAVDELAAAIHRSEAEAMQDVA